MDTREQVRNFEGAIDQNDEAWAAWCESFNQIAQGLVDAWWDITMTLPEEGRDQLFPGWRESYARWREHRTGASQ